MALPVMINGVHYYRIAGRYTFAGDLFVTRGTIYFFPMVDLEEQRSKYTKHVPHQIGLIVFAFMYLLQSLSASYFSSNQVWKDGISDEEFRRRADAHIEAMKVERDGKGFGDLLPVPTRVRGDEISNLKLSLTGKLSFFAQSDNHDFNIGWRSRNRLRDALWESGLGRV